MSRLGVRILDEDWVLIEGSPEALTFLANEILRVAGGGSPALTLDHPGPLITPESTHGLVVAPEGGTW